MKKVLIALVCLVLASCQEPGLPNIISTLASGDRVLPALLSSQTVDMRSTLLTFSKNVTVMDASLDGDPVTVTRPAGHTVLVTADENMEVSVSSSLFIRVRDESYNSAAFSLLLFARNTNLPEVRINEFSSKGTDTQPQRIELEVRKDGNTEGLTVMDGTKGNEKHSYTLPSYDVRKGDYIVIWWTVPPKEELVVNGDIQVINLYAGSEDALPSNNGAFVVYPTPGGDEDVIDALVYTNGEATTYSGFGSASVEASWKELTASFDWMGPAFNSKWSTSTRTVNRILAADNDTNTANDFYICTTRGETFGAMNSSQPYVSSDE